MAGNTFGELFSVTTFGESHGIAIGCVVDGCPPGIILSENDIQPELDKRRPGAIKETSQRQELDQVEILSGVFESKTTGAPIALLIKNVDAKPQHYEDIKNKFRPGHADFTYHHKYRHRDYRGGGRASARETATRVAAGAIAKKILSPLGIHINAAMVQMGPIFAETIDLKEAKNNALYFADPKKIKDCENLIAQLRSDGDSVGAKLHLIATNVPIGLGEPVFDKLDANIAHAMMSIPAIKSVEIGDGVEVANQLGSEHRDEITPTGFSSNHSGGTLGGISSGQDIVVKIAVKPPSSIRIPGNTIDTEGNPCEIVTTGRHDPCVGIRAVPVAEAMMALVLVDLYLKHHLCLGPP